MVPLAEVLIGGTLLLLSIDPLLRSRPENPPLFFLFIPDFDLDALRVLVWLLMLTCLFPFFWLLV